MCEVAADQNVIVGVSFRSTPSQDPSIAVPSRLRSWTEYCLIKPMIPNDKYWIPVPAFYKRQLYFWKKI